ncbi:hypothetical protein V6N13_104958 [Hibiscus sabdariffa]
MGYAMDADEDEFLVVGERINVAVENEGVGDGHVAPIGTEKVSYANMVVESKGLDEDVARETCSTNTATSDVPVHGDGPSKTNKSLQKVEVS